MRSYLGQEPTLLADDMLSFLIKLLEIPVTFHGQNEINTGSDSAQKGSKRKLYAQATMLHEAHPS